MKKSSTTKLTISHEGTGWSTSVPSYNPIEIAECVSSLLRGTNSKRSLHPWVREFRGVVLPASNLKSSGIFESCGIVSLKYGVVEVITIIKQLRDQ